MEFQRRLARTGITTDAQTTHVLATLALYLLPLAIHPLATRQTTLVRRTTRHSLQKSPAYGHQQHVSVSAIATSRSPSRKSQILGRILRVGTG